MPWINPKVDWVTNPKNPKSEDLNRIEGNIEFLKNDIETKKGAIVDALNNVGIATLISDTHVQIASKITGAEKTGVVITPSTVDQPIPKGIFDTGGGVVIGDPDLITDNIKAGANIFGKAGKASVVDTADATVVAGGMLSGQTGYKNGAKITGTIPSKGAQTFTPSTVNQTIGSGQYLSGVQTIAGSANLIPANIGKNKNIFNVIGSFTGIKRVVGTYLRNNSSGVGGTYALSPACVPANCLLFAVYPGRNNYAGQLTLTTTDITLSSAYAECGVVLIEFEAGIIKSKQELSVKNNGDAIYPITAVDMAKTIVVAMGYSIYKGNVSAACFYLNSPTELFANTGLGSAIKVGVVEFY